MSALDHVWGERRNPNFPGFKIVKKPQQQGIQCAACNSLDGFAEEHRLGRQASNAKALADYYNSPAGQRIYR